MIADRKRVWIFAASNAPVYFPGAMFAIAAEAMSLFTRETMQYSLSLTPATIVSKVFEKLALHK